MKRNRVLGVLAALAITAAFLTGCEREERPWPSRAIQVIVPFAAGAESDFNARAYALRLGPVLGQSIVVQNMSGGGGAVGAIHAARAAPDGYTVIQWHSGIGASHAAGTSQLLLDDFEVAAIAAMSDLLVVVNAASPFQTLNEFMDATKAAPDTILYAVTFGGPSHVTGLLLSQAGAMFRMVDGGDTAHRNTSLMGRHIDAAPSSYGAVAPFIASGDFRALAVMSPQRNSLFAHVPTTVELGFPGAVHPLYFFWAFPRGTPAEIVEKFADALEHVFHLEDYRRSIMETFHQYPFFLRGEDALNLLRAQQDEIIQMSAYF